MAFYLFRTVIIVLTVCHLKVINFDLNGRSDHMTDIHGIKNRTQPK